MIILFQKFYFLKIFLNLFFNHVSLYRFDGVAVITSALHAEGREFDPRSKYFFFHFYNLIYKKKYLKIFYYNLLKKQKNLKLTIRKFLKLLCDTCLFLNNNFI